MAPKRDRIRIEVGHAAAEAEETDGLVRLGDDAVLHLARLIGRQMAREQVARERAKERRAERQRRAH